MASHEEQNQLKCFFQNWMTQQGDDLEELLQALTLDSGDENKLRLVVERNLLHLQEYCDQRLILGSVNAPFFFCPSWCTSFENSFLWIAGCRPSLCIRLVYSQCGSQIEAQLSEFLQGVRRGNLGELSARQLNLVNDLQCRTIREEEKLSTQMASLQENIADHPLVKIANESNRIGESSESVDQALDAHARALGKMMEEADKLRMNTFKELIDILTPLQSVDLLITMKRLHLSIHEWSKRKYLHTI